MFFNKLIITIICIGVWFNLSTNFAYAGSNLKVLTFNIIGTVGDTQANETNTLNHIEDIVELIIDSGADVVGLQEVRTLLDPNDPKDTLMLILAGLKAKGYNYNHQSSYSFTFGVFGKDYASVNTVLSRFNIEDHVRLETNNNRFSVFKISLPEGYVRFMNIHPYYTNSCNSINNDHSIIQQYFKNNYKNDALIILGDFNAQPIETCIQEYFKNKSQGGLDLAQGCDTFINSECSNTVNFELFGGVSGGQIDHILYSKNASAKSLTSNLNVKLSTVYNSDTGYISNVTGKNYTTRFSDHFPVLVEFELLDLTPRFRYLAMQYYKELLGWDVSYNDTGVVWHGDNIKKNGCTADVLNFATAQTFQDRKSSYSDVQYIRMLYRAILSREPEKAGLEWFLSLIRSGQSRDWVLNVILDSTEAGVVCSTQKTIDPLIGDLNNDKKVDTYDSNILVNALFSRSLFYVPQSLIWHIGYYK